MATSRINNNKTEFDKTTVQSGDAFYHDEFKWIRFVTWYLGDPIFEYWELTKLGKTQKFGIFDIDNLILKRFKEKDALAKIYQMDL